jgi:GAF domain-containing protein
MSILNSIRNFFAPPVFEADEEKTRIARLLNTVLWIQAALPFVLIANAVLIPANRPFVVPSAGFLVVTLIVEMYFMRRGYVSAVSAVTVAFLLGLIGTLAYLNGGEARPLNIYYTLIIVIAGLLLGGRGAIFSAIVSALIIGVVTFAGAAGLLTVQTQAPTPLSAWLTYAVGFMLIGLALRLASSSIGDLLSRARQGEQALRELNLDLEQRVASRTRDLALAAEVGRGLSQIRDLDTLLADAVERIRSSYDLYYTQIYLVDSTGTALVMQVGTGGIGAELKRRAFRLPIGSGSLNGTAAATRQPVLVADTTQSSTFRPNPLLPNTRSELAVPLMVGDKVIGVLDLQSSRPNTFTEDNQQAFDVLAGQLATSIQNNRLFSEAEAARIELEQQASRLARSGWEDFLDGIHNQEVIQATYSAPAAEATQLVQPQVITAPITVVGQEIGSLRLESGRALSDAETQLVEAVAAQVARQIESIRLLAQAEQYRLEAEQTVRRYTREGWSAYTAGDATANSYEYNGNRVISVPADAPKAHADLVKPIVVRGETIGEINLDGLTVVDEQAVQLLEAVSNQLSTHIEILRQAEQTQNALAQTETLYNITGQLNASNTLTEIMQTIANIKSANRMTLMTIDLDDQGQPATINIAAYWPADAVGDIPLGTRLPLSQFPVSQSWIDNPDEPLFYEDMTTDPTLDDYTRDFNLKRGIRGAIYMALRVGAQWVGLLGISWATPQRFSPTDRQLYRAVAAQAAVVINNRLLFEQTQKRSERESIINAISQRIQSTTTVEGALEAATREIGQLLRAKRALAEIGVRPSNGRAAQNS